VSAGIVVAVVLAGGLAAVARYGVSVISARFSAPAPLGFPWAVLVVNVVGSAIGGVAIGLAQAGVIPADLRLVLLSGVAGGLTTFSTFSVETVQLIETGRWRTAATSVLANLAVGLAAVTSAWLLVSRL